MSKEFQIQMVSLNPNMIDQISNEITVLTKKVNNLTQSHGYNVDTAKRGGVISSSLGNPLFLGNN